MRAEKTVSGLEIVCVGSYLHVCIPASFPARSDSESDLQVALLARVAALDGDAKIGEGRINSFREDFAVHYSIQPNTIPR